jgi:hypothetical protein
MWGQPSSAVRSSKARLAFLPATLLKPERFSGWREPSEEVWLSLSQGLRGSDPGVVWRVEIEPAALETRPKDNEIKNS